MTCLHLSRLLALYGMFCAARDAPAVQGARDFEKKVSLMLKEEPENPKCFTESRNDFTCFWEEDEERAGSVDQYSFTYTYQNENGSSCPLSSLPLAGGKRLFVCRLDRPQMFVQMDVRVHREGTLIHSRSLLVELVFLLDAPVNVTVSSTGQKGQLNVSWVAPPLKYMDDSMMYEVGYAAEDGHAGQVEVVHAGSEVILRGLQPGTRYTVQVRVKLDGISYNGYWSAWSDPVVMETLPAELDLLIVSLTFIISFFLIALSLFMLLTQRRFVIKKIWPVIPTPDSKFPGLFTVYGGDFQEWLGQTSGGSWVTPECFSSEECSSPLEVLSELSPSLPPEACREAAGRKEDEAAARGLDHSEPGRRDAALPERWRASPHDRWLVERLRALHHNHRSSLLESQDAYVTLSGDHHGEAGPPDAALEEASPLQLLFASSKTASCESHSDLGSAPQSSGSGGLRSQCSFEFPDRQAWRPKGPAYAYMAVADSGVSMDYSPMSRGDHAGNVFYANEYKNEVPGLRGPVLPRQQPAGLHMD